LVSASNLTEARRNGARLPAAALIDQFYAEVQAMDGRRWDTPARNPMRMM
jgi:3-hydroxyisobutyrate dehydrogenase-like beta-hydroxyacid dehydrogenase